jgi:hypothetical protein
MSVQCRRTETFLPMFWFFLAHAAVSIRLQSVSIRGPRHAAQKADKPLKELGWTHGMAVAKQRSLILVMFNCAFSNAESVQLGPCAEKE